MSDIKLTLTLTELEVLYDSGYKQYTIKPGSFHEALFMAYYLADTNNREKLAREYPEIAAAIESYLYGSLIGKYYAYRDEVDNEYSKLDKWIGGEE